MRSKRDDTGALAEHDQAADELPAGLIPLMQEIVNHTKTNPVATNWRTDTFVVTAGVSRLIARARHQRSRAALFTDVSNTTPVWVSSTNVINDPTGHDRNGAIPLAPGSGILELHHSGELHVYSNAAAVVYLIEEFLA